MIMCAVAGADAVACSSIPFLQVQTYHISTMTISQRKALASAWLQEGNSSSNNLAPGQMMGSARSDLPEVEESDASTSSTRSSVAEQKDVLETWMLMVRDCSTATDRGSGQKVQVMRTSFLTSGLCNALSVK